MGLIQTTVIIIAQDWFLTSLILTILQLILTGNEAVQVSSDTNNQNQDPTKDDATFPSSSKYNTLTVFPITQAEDEEKFVSSSKEVVESDERKGTEAQKLRETEGNEEKLLHSENKECTIKSERSEVQIGSSQNSIQKLKDNDGERSQMSMQLEDVDQVSQSIQEVNVVQKLGQQKRMTVGQLSKESL